MKHVPFVRQQPGLPTLADAVAALCPSIVGIEPADAMTAGAQSAAITGFAMSTDGWVMAATASLPDGQLQAVFGPANAAPVSEVRSEPDSGSSILKTNATGLRPVPRSDQTFPRVGDFGFAIQNPQGAGCSAEAAMVASDFLTDGGAPVAYVRLDPMGADIEDELLRDSLSPTREFGFRAADFPPTIAARLSDSRAIGTGIALIQPKSAAARAGLRAGDIVGQVNGSPVASASELGRALDAAGKSASMDLVGGDQRLSVSLARTAGS
jgi:S1-C subfamily serine protease